AHIARRAAHDDLDLQDLRILGFPELRDQVVIMPVDPRSQEGGRHRKTDMALGYLRQLHAAEPGGIDFTAQARLQLSPDTLEYALPLVDLRHIAFLNAAMWERKVGLDL